MNFLYRDYTTIQISQTWKYLSLSEKYNFHSGGTVTRQRALLYYMLLMEQKNSQEIDTKKMLADYMENGLLDNIIDMFKYDKNLYEYAGYLMADERMRVRIGVIALFETLKKEDSENISRAVPYMLPLLKDQNPVIRGDAANLLGIIGNKDAIPFLEEMLNDTDENVRIIAEEAIEDIKTNALSL